MMPFKHALFSFHGRMRRRDWWLWSIGLLLSQTLANRVTDTLLFGPDADLRAGNYFTWFFGTAPVTGVHWTGLAVGLLFLWPALALTLKRGRDRDRRGRELVFIQLAAAASLLLPVDVFETAGRAFDAADYTAAAPAMLYGLALLIGSLYQLVVLGFLDGTPGPNRFGTSPKGIGGDTAEVFS
jgi:uncharacterized membrane protein YhaH (DUF805 family)